MVPIHNYKLRPVQIKVIEQIQDKIKQGYTTIIVCAPTGVGKSLIGYEMARRYDRSFIVTATKQLQNQYTNDLTLSSIKGKSNFACMQLMDEDEVCDDTIAKERELTCDKGICVKQETDQDGNIQSTVCEYKPEMGYVIERNMCHYYTQKYQGLLDPHTVLNYSMYFTMLQYNAKQFGDYINRDIVIYDEAHKIEDVVLQFLGAKITARHLDDCNLSSTGYNFRDMDNMVLLGDELARRYAKMLKDVDMEPKQYATIKNRFDWYLMIYREWSKNTSNFVINDVVTTDNKFESVIVRPVDIAPYVSTFFENGIQIFMSATIDKDNFCANMGLDKDRVAMIDVPKSPFSPEHRKVNLLNIRAISSKSSPEDEMVVINKIDELLTKHSKERGLVLTSSRKRCESILKNLSDNNAERVTICHSTSNKYNRTQDEILEAHQYSDNGVLLSSSLWEGIDLKDDLSRFQIIAKVPYMDYTEVRTRAKMDRQPLWYDGQALIKVLQGLGRSIRNDKDWAVTYILDSSIKRLLKHKQMIPQAYHDVLGV